jgi:hypothetical protein
MRTRTGADVGQQTDVRRRRLVVGPEATEAPVWRVGRPVRRAPPILYITYSILQYSISESSVLLVL